MTLRIGLYVGADDIAAIALRNQRIVWHATAGRNAEMPLEPQLASVLHGAPRSRIVRPTIFVALGPALARVKVLRGLPPIKTPDVLRQLIEGAPSRFFLETTDTPVVAEPMRANDGWWVAVADGKTVADVRGALIRCGLRDGGVRPVATLIDRALADVHDGARIAWCDGTVQVDVAYGAQGIASLASAQRACEERVDGAVLDTALVRLGDSSWRLAGAYAAARGGAASPLAFNGSSDDRSTSRRMVRRVAAAAALVIGIAVTMFAPATIAARTRQENERAFEALRTPAASAARARAALEQQETALRQVRAFAASRRLITPALSSLSLQLPESTAIVALRVDTLGVTFVALSPVGTPVMESISEMPGVDALQLTAPITRELVGPTELQRVALRFRFKRRGAAPGKARS